jgi:hypothetical protein
MKRGIVKVKISELERFLDLLPGSIDAIQEDLTDRTLKVRVAGIGLETGPGEIIPILTKRVTYE